MSGFEGIEEAGLPKKATENQLDYIYDLLDDLGEPRWVDPQMSREEASELIDDLLFELQEKRGK